MREEKRVGRRKEKQGSCRANDEFLANHDELTKLESDLQELLENEMSDAGSEPLSFAKLSLFLRNESPLTPRRTTLVPKAYILCSFNSYRFTAKTTGQLLYSNYSHLDHCFSSSSRSFSSNKRSLLTIYSSNQALNPTIDNSLISCKLPSTFQHDLLKTNQYPFRVETIRFERGGNRSLYLSVQSTTRIFFPNPFCEIPLNSSQFLVSIRSEMTL